METLPSLPTWLTWQQRPFPDANLLLIRGRHPALIDSGFVGHAAETADWVRARTTGVEIVVNTHWHSDHVGGNARFQADGAAIAASDHDAAAVQRRDPACCAAEYLDQPIAPYHVDMALHDGELVPLGDTDWMVVATPGHTAGHLALWQPDERVLAVGDALSDYDVGWVNVAWHGADMAKTAVASLERLRDLEPRVILPAHGPIPSDTTRAFAQGLRRAQRLVDDTAGAVWYGARRIFAYALMIRGGIETNRVMEYLLARAWLIDAARLLDTSAEQLADELVSTMLASGAVTTRGGRVHAVADHTPVPPATVRVPFPRDW